MKADEYGMKSEAKVVEVERLDTADPVTAVFVISWIMGAITGAALVGTTLNAIWREYEIATYLGVIAFMAVIFVLWVWHAPKLWIVKGEPISDKPADAAGKK